MAAHVHSLLDRITMIGAIHRAIGQASTMQVTLPNMAKNHISAALRRLEPRAKASISFRSLAHNRQ
jgi:hypothetical protein